MIAKRVAIPLTLEHQELLEGYWKPLRERFDLPYAEFCFANVYLFRETHKYRLLEGDPPLVIGGNGSRYLIPTVGPEKLSDLLPLLMDQPSFAFFPIPEEWRSQITNGTYKSNHNDSDYLFHTEKLRTLAGRKLSSRRNLIHQMEGNYVMTSSELTQDNLKDAQLILDDWQAANALPPEKTDFQAAQEGLNAMKTLELHGRIAYADGMPAGFTMGIQLTKNSSVILFAKRRHDLKGMVPFLYRDFARHLSPESKWINLEQDLGNPALRQAKEAYQPDLILDKWYLYPQQGAI